MTYERFEDLPVWQEAIKLAHSVYRLTEDIAFQKQYSLRDQLERAAVSVSNNIVLQRDSSAARRPSCSRFFILRGAPPGKLGRCCV